MWIQRMIAVGVVLVLAATQPLSAGLAAEGRGETPAEVVKTNGEVKIKLNFQDAPLQTVLEYLSETAGLAVVSDEPIVDGRMTVISRQPIALSEAVSLINSILKEKGLTTVLTGKTLKVVTLQNAKKENLPVLAGRNPDAVIAGDDVVTYVVPVSHVTAVALKNNLQALLPEYASLEANEDGNALIITDTTANIKRLMQIVVALDTHMANVAEIRVFRLVNANATSAAALINSIFQQQAQSGSRTRQSGRGFGGPLEMIMQMRGGPDRGRGGDDQNRSTQGGGSVNVEVVAAADEQTNSVVVRGPAEALDLVADVIKALDDRTAKVADVRVFQLRYADAMNTADVINQLFNQSQSGTAARGRTGRGATGGDMGPMMFRGPFGGPGGDMQQAEGATMVQVSAAADSRTNTVVVTGPEAVLNVVAGVIEKLDSQIANVADVKVFHLRYASASDTASLINEVFGQQGSGTSRTSSRTGQQQNRQVMFQRGGFGAFGGMPGAQQQAGQGGSLSDLSVIAAADTRTNSVVVSGPPETLAAIAQIIKELDENPEQERRIFVYFLNNANATNLMTILNNLFQEMQSLTQQTLGRTGAQFQGTQRGGATGATGATGAVGGTSTGLSDDELAGYAYFQADPNTNSLLCMTSTKNYEKIKPIIEDLDKPVGQVLIKILFAELTHTDNVDWGTEFSMLNIRSGGDFTRTIQTFPPVQTSGLSVQTVQGDVDITIRALQETGRLNVLSRPYVLTRNNQMATITVAEEVPYPTGSSLAQGQSQVTFDYRRDIGIVLEVTPSINPEGLVNMTVSPKITTRTRETVQISEDLFPEVFATRSAITQVAVLNGQTIVIGGLIEDQTSETISKVPILGDIPIAGQLFRRNQQNKKKTELLIFLTPHVAEDPQALLPISDVERARSKLNTDGEAAEVFRRHLDAMRNDANEVPNP